MRSNLEGLVAMARAEDMARQTMEEEGEEEEADVSLVHRCTKNDLAVLALAACLPHLEMLVVDMTAGTTH